MDDPTPREQAQQVEHALLRDLRAATADRGVKWYAAELGVGHETLLHKLGPDEEGHHLTLRQALLLLVLADPAPVLRGLAREFGGQYLAPPDAGRVGSDLHRLMAEAVRELGEVSDAMLKATDAHGPGGSAWTDGELEELERQAQDVRERMDRIVEAARVQRVATLPTPRRRSAR